MSNKLNIVFFGSSDFSVPALHALYNCKDIVIKYVVTKQDKEVGRRQHVKPNIVALHATKLKIPVLKVTNLVKNPKQLDKINFKNIDFAVVVSFGYIIPPKILCQLPNRFINLHASLLPKYRGASPVQQAVINGDMVTGNSIIVLQKEVDSGPILSQKSYKVEKTQTIDKIFAFLADKGAKLLVNTLIAHSKGKIKPIEQQHSKATFTKIFTKNDGFVTLTEKPLDIYNKYRALKIWPQVYTTVANLEQFASIKTKIADKKTLVKLTELMLKNNETLQIVKLQLPNKAPIGYKDFINGYKTN